MRAGTSIRATLALATLLAASSGCRLSRLFDLNRDVQVDETHTPGVDLLLHYDLAEAAWLQQSHPGEPAALSLDSADITISQVDTAAGTNDVQSLSGRLLLRPDGDTGPDGEVLLGIVSGLPLQEGATATLQGSPEIDALLLAALRGSGRFQLAFDFQLAGGRDAHLVLWISLHATAGYDAGP